MRSRLGSFPLMRGRIKSWQLGVDERNWAMFSVASDDTLTRAKAALSKSRIRDLQRLTISQGEDRIVLYGRASSYYHKQLAQELIRCELPDVEVVNKMQVEYPCGFSEQYRDETQTSRPDGCSKEIGF